MMAHHRTTVDIPRESRTADTLVPLYRRAGLVIGVAGLALSIVIAFVAGPPVFFRSFAVNFAYFLSLALGALFFVLIQHVTRAGWSVVVRRLAEIVAGTMPWFAVASIGVLIGMNSLYPWVTPEAHGEDLAQVIAPKSVYLNPTFFIARFVLYFLVLIGLAKYLLSRSIAQDESGDPQLTLDLERFSAPGIVLYGVVTTFLAFDLMMSRSPMWYSTIYGVYYFAGAVVGFMALLILICFWLQQSGRLANVISTEHYHDMGKLLFAFTIFWAYIAFSQYMLIWYGNIPEETAWYHARQTGGWGSVGLFLVFGHFLAPFLLLMSRVPKRRALLIAIGACWMLVAHWFDVFYLLAPEPGQARVPLHLLDGTLFVAFAGFFVAAVTGPLGRYSLIPTRDPRLAESVAFENF